MGNCGRISSNLLQDCDNPMIGGTDDVMYVINHDDWKEATITRDASNNQLITGITLASSRIAYKFEGKNNSIEPRAALAKGRYYELYDHEVIFKVFDNSAEVKAEVEALAKGRYVIIIENSHKGAAGESAFEVYGDESGLELAEGERAVSDTETQGAFNLTLRSSEYSRESHLPATLYDTDYATTKAIVTGLLTA